MKVLTGTANPFLAQRICDYLEMPLGNCAVKRFPDGEITVKINEDVRGRDLFLVQSTCPPVNDHLMELLIMMDCARRASVNRLTAVIPYFGYARQDRKDEGRVPITAKLVANLLTKAGADRIVALDLHAAQIQGFFDIPVDHLYSAPILCQYFAKMNLPDLTVVAPDVGSMKIARAYAKALGAGLAVVDKRRVSPSETVADFVIGDVQDRTVVLVDDMITTGGSVCEAARVLSGHGAGDIYVTAAHAVLSDPATQRLLDSPIKKVVVTDTIPTNATAQQLGDRLKVLSAASLLGEAMRRSHNNESISSLFAGYHE